LVNAGGGESNSLVHINWDNRTTNGSDTYVMTTYYGVKDIVEITEGEVGFKEVQVLDHYETVTETSGGVRTETIKKKPLWIQSAANGGQGMFVDRYDCRPEALYRGIWGSGEVGGDLSRLSVATAGDATASLKAIDLAFGRINSYRARAGAQYNRLEYTGQSLAVSFTNLEDAKSRITDADMAKEMMELTKSQTLNQVGVSMLSQANQSPQTVLQLLR
jgi:flagellin-like hook-associated protein FlgL